MRFIKAYIDGYGKFHNKDFIFEPGFNLILGPNEAGKTTMMSFLRSIFFGFPGKKSAFDRYEPLAGGIHGGKLEIETTDKKTVSVSLKPGRKLTGEVIVLKEDGTELSGDSARKDLQILLHGVSENIYKTVFAFSLTELQRLELLEDDEINAHIYSAGTGVGDVALPDVLNRVEEERNKIYKHGGTAQIVPKITKKLEQIRNEIAGIKGDMERYKDTTTAINDLKQEQGRLTDVISKKRKEKDKASKLKSGRENINELVEIDKQISDLPTIPEGFQAESKDRLDKDEQKVEDKKLELWECQTQIKDIDAKVHSIEIDNAVLEAEHLITSMTVARSAEVENIKRIDNTELELNLQKITMAKAITDIGSGWDEERILIIDTGMETSVNIRVLVDKLSDAKVNVDKAEESVANEKKYNEEISKDFLEFTRRTKGTGSSWRPKLLLILGTLMSIGLGVFCWMTLNQLSGIVAGIIVIVITIATYIIIGKPQDGSSDELNRHLNKMRETKKKSTQETEKTFSDRKEEYSQALQKWQAWLKEKGLSIELDRNGIFALIDLVKKAKDLISKKDETEKVLEYIRQRADSYLGRVNDALKSCSMEETSLGALSQAIHQLEDNLNRQKKAVDNKTDYETRIDGLKTREKSLLDSISVIENAIQRLIIDSGVQDADEYRRCSKTFSTRESLREQKGSLEIQIARLIGGSKEIEKFKEEVAAESDPVETDRSIDELSCEIEEKEKELSVINQNIGAKSNRISELERSKKLGELRFKEESMKAQLKEAISEWSVNALCYTLLNRAMAIYERERQPLILKQAGEYFDLITEGRYSHVIKKVDDNKIVVETSEGLQKEVTALSRGTAEQLYLSMRLAFIKENSGRAGTLPLIIDDILVNFDPQRAATTIRLLNEISKENQIIMFTCHPGTLELCMKEIKGFRKAVMIDV